MAVAAIDAGLAQRAAGLLDRETTAAGASQWRMPSAAQPCAIICAGALRGTGGNGYRRDGSHG